MNLIKKNGIAVAILVVVILGAGLVTLNQNNQSAKNQTKQINTASTDQTKSELSVQIKADGATKAYQVKNAVGKTALEVTKSAISDIKMTGEGENAFITTINGREATSDKKEFWKLVINGQDAQVGAGSYIVKANDKISWEIATY